MTVLTVSSAGCIGTVEIPGGEGAQGGGKMGDDSPGPTLGDSCIPCGVANCELCPTDPDQIAFRCQDSSSAPMPGNCYATGSLFTDDSGFYVCVLCSPWPDSPR